MNGLQRLLLLVTVALPVLGLGGCGERVEVPTAHVGKVMTSSGLEEGIRSPSSFRLPVNFFGGNPSELILVQASDQQQNETMVIFMPLDSLNLTVDVRGTYSIANTAEQVNPIYDRVKPLHLRDRVWMINFEQVYKIYAQRVIWVTSREIITKYDIAHVMANRQAISSEIRKELGKRLAKTPITLIEFNLSTVQPPQLIVDAEAAAKKRQVEIEKARADRLVKITEAEARLAVAKRQQMVDLVQADTNRQVGLKLTRGVNPAFVQQRALSILDGLGDNRIIIIPEEALANPALMMSIYGRSFDKEEQASQVIPASAGSTGTLDADDK